MTLCASLLFGISDLPAVEIFTKPLVLTLGGTPDSPVVSDGKGMIVDLASDVTNSEWKKIGDIWEWR